MELAGVVLGAGCEPAWFQLTDSKCSGIVLVNGCFKCRGHGRVHANANGKTGAEYNAVSYGMRLFIA